MSNSKVIQDQIFGEVLLVKSKRAKRINISVRPSQPVRVSMPYWTSYQEGLEILHENINFVAEAKQKVKKKEELRQKFIPGNDYEIAGLKFSIRSMQSIEHTEHHEFNNQVKILIPENTIHLKETQDRIRQIITIYLMEKAKEELPERVKELSERHNLPYKQVKIRNTKSIWGSCSPENNIMLSCHIMRLPLELINYVILHELMHTIEKSHGPRFWNGLETMVSDARKRDKEMNNYSLSNY